MPVGPLVPTIDAHFSSNDQQGQAGIGASSLLTPLQIKHHLNTLLFHSL